MFDYYHRIETEENIIQFNVVGEPGIEAYRFSTAFGFFAPNIPKKTQKLSIPRRQKY